MTRPGDRMTPTELTRRGFDNVGELLAAYDAAVRDIGVLRETGSSCEICRHFAKCDAEQGPDDCKVWNHNKRFEWRGVS